jgi:hypothetical protein
MGYDIISAKSKKEMDQGNILSHIQCQYAYQPIFRQAFDRDISEWNGRLTKKRRGELLRGIDNLTLILESGVNIPMHTGNISNCSPGRLKKEVEELKGLIRDGKIGYIRIT